MIVPPTFAVIRARLTRVLLGFGAWVLALVVAAPALAGDRREPDTFILTGPDLETASPTADFTFTSTAARAAFYCLLDGDETTEYVPCDTPWRVEGLGLGEHLLWVYSVDLDTELPDPSPALWEWTVVEGPPLDAGSPDAGPGGQDGGPSGSDGGTPGGGDSGTSGGDGGTPGGEDSGTSGGDSGTPGGQDAGTSGGSDSGTPGGEDSGTSSGEDAGGPGGQDAGPSAGEDAGPGAPGDAGTPGGGADAGDGQPLPPPPGDAVPPEALDYLGGGVGCTGAPAPGALAGLLLLVLALNRRRRR